MVSCFVMSHLRSFCCRRVVILEDFCVLFHHNVEWCYRINNIYFRSYFRWQMLAVRFSQIDKNPRLITGWSQRVVQYVNI